ncbi:STM4504/CBY_0614 family protein [Nostoc sp.]|uniref:STM4504/CBY_0614 family protein n=1 Tax=Nostoc sp. TaxID=1180 RepID=UPI002FF73CD3
MKVYDIYSKRQKRLRGQFPDVYQYVDIPQALRVQIVYIINDVIAEQVDLQFIRNFSEIYSRLYREYGKLQQLIVGKDIINLFMFNTQETEHVLDFIELSFKLIDYTYTNRTKLSEKSPKLTAETAIEELNSRFREHGLGYQYESGEIIRVDSQRIHAEAVKPVLILLSDTRFQGANEEFLKAHEHYRHGRYKECLVECLKAFESTMKTICDIRGWIYQPGDTAKNLINLCFQNNLIPTYLQTQVTSLKSSLESGVPTMRNKNAGHGQGSQPLTVPQYFAAYQLHMTASTILFLLEAEKALP